MGVIFRSAFTSSPKQFGYESLVEQKGQGTGAVGAYRTSIVPPVQPLILAETRIIQYLKPGSITSFFRAVFPLTLAKRLCRTVDRFNPEGMH